MPRTCRWIGGNNGATSTAQVSSAVFASYNTGSTRTITIGGITVNNGVDATDLTTTLAALATYLNTLTHPYFAAMTWSSDATHVLATADTAGVPFTFTAATTGVGATTNTVTVTTTSKGPNDWSTAANWDTATLPVSGDTVLLDGTSDFALAQGLATGIYFNYRIDQAHTALIGLGRSFTSDVAGITVTPTEVPEYRSQYLAMTAAADAVSGDIGRDFGSGNAQGCQRIKIDHGDATATINVWNSASLSSDDGLQPIQFKFGTNPYSTIYVRKGLVGIGQQTETCTLLECDIADTSSFSRVVMGTGVTCAITKQNGGSITLNSAASQACTVNGGTLSLEGTVTVATLIINNGTVYANGAMTITACTVGTTGYLDTTQSGRALTITTLTLMPGAQVRRGANLTVTNALAFSPTTQPVLLTSR